MGNTQFKRMHCISLVDVEEWRPPNSSTDVWLYTVCHVADSCCGIDYMTIVVLVKDSTMPGLWPQGGFLREQEGLYKAAWREHCSRYREGPCMTKQHARTEVGRYPPIPQRLQQLNIPNNRPQQTWMRLTQ